MKRFQLHDLLDGSEGIDVTASSSSDPKKIIPDLLHGVVEENMDILDHILENFGVDPEDVSERQALLQGKHPIFKTSEVKDLVQDLISLLDSQCPEGFVFTDKAGKGLGYWPIVVAESRKKKTKKKSLRDFRWAGGLGSCPIIASESRKKKVADKKDVEKKPIVCERCGKIITESKKKVLTEKELDEKELNPAKDDFIKFLEKPDEAVSMISIPDDVPEIPKDFLKTFGILTSDNPLGQAPKRFPSKNSANYRIMNEYLDAKNFDYVKILGKYGGEEHSFLIVNPSLSEMKFLAGYFHQNSFIFGVRKTQKEYKLKSGSTEGTSLKELAWEVYLWQMDNVRDVVFGNQDPHYVEIKKVVHYMDESEAEDYYSVYESGEGKVKFNLALYDEKAKLDDYVYNDILEEINSQTIEQDNELKKKDDERYEKFKPLDPDEEVEEFDGKIDYSKS